MNNTKINNNRKSERNTLFDLCKCFAITLVLVGHSIQYGAGTEYFTQGMFFDNKLFLLIYSFHMPLFMLLSGFLYWKSINKYLPINIILKKIKTLVIPILFWSLIPLLINIRNTLAANNQISIKITILDYCNIFINNLWFLWAIFWLSLIVLIGNRLFKDNILFYIILYVILFFLPDSLFLNTSLYLYKYTYFFFVIGYLFNKYDLQNRWKNVINNKISIIVMLILFVMLFIFFNKDMLIYISAFTVIGKDIATMLYINVYRDIIGLVGSICAILILKLLSDNINKQILSPLLYIGKNTLGIYIISCQIYLYVFPKFSFMIETINYGFIFIETVVVMLSCILIILLINNFNKLVLGKWS